MTQTPTNQVDFMIWASQVIVSFEAQQLLWYTIFGLAGIFGHYLKKYLTNEIEGSFRKYIMQDHPKRSIMSVLSFIGLGAGFVFSGATVGMGWAALICLAFSNGYNIDSVVNKNSKPEDQVKP